MTMTDGSGRQMADTGDRSFPSANVSMVEGVQVIDIDARGGYSPRTTLATAGIPTIIKLNTSGTYDCSLAVRIPSISFSDMLSPRGTREVDIGEPKRGVMQILCSMGMYGAQIEFRD